MQWHTFFYVLLLCLKRVDAQCAAGSYGGSSSQSNVANTGTGSTAFASSIYNQVTYPPVNAINGNYGNGPYATWVSLNPSSSQEWLAVDLKSSKTITKVVYYPWDGVSVTDNFDVRVGNSDTVLNNAICATASLPTNTHTSVNCAATGRYVSLHRKTTGSMAVTEFEVWSGGCTLCPTFSTSPANSISVTGCTCNAGYTGPGGGPCTLCTAGKYSSSGGICQSCSSDTVSNAARTACINYCDPITQVIVNSVCVDPTQCGLKMYRTTSNTCANCPANT